jgi:hypothetical protein
MKVKTFAGTRKAVLDKEVNDWIAKSKVAVVKTNVAFKALSEKGPDFVVGRTTARRGVAVAITVWYDDSYGQPPTSKPTIWELESPETKKSRTP